MNNIIKGFLFISFLLITITSCKLDKPVYPEGLTVNTGTGTGSDTTGTGVGTGTGSDTTGTDTTITNNGEGLPIGPTNTIQIKTQGEAIKTYSQNVAFVSLLGFTTINAINSQSDLFMLSILNDVPGTYDIDMIQAGELSLDTFSPGKVVVTAISFDIATNKGSIKGTFSTDMRDTAGELYPHVIGSFNITQ